MYVCQLDQVTQQEIYEQLSSFLDNTDVGVAMDSKYDDIVHLLK